MRPTRLLILGGTTFVGRALAEDALARGWSVTTFTRGRAEPPPGAAPLRGDRTAAGGLAALAEGEWDLVVDTWSDAPRAVRDAARLLAGRARHFTYVSSRSVYAWPIPAGADEGAPVVDASPDADADATDYAADKRGGELAAEAEFGGDLTLFVRCGLILGPHENVGRLPWWLARVARGGPVLAPGPRELPLQYVDARDLARWTLDAAERGLSGPVDLVSPSGHATMGGLLDACVAATGSATGPATGPATAELRWTAPERVEAAGIAGWTELPIWTPPGELHDALHRSDVTRALGTGLRCRPVEETVADTWRWVRSLGGALPAVPTRGALGLDPAKEAEALA
ncbi:NAD-dependent epimerase/dehydratase family protein [Streptomyces radicis]|uniref:NAD-dependent epimerase/dehydratase family protein n=1 Tax=Streptomyces radicis TaxID=1750517 RepID=A0A3A9WBG8_9ACTN|nr:NAD-dependent epimerase/dehydratase family protein [Streptomyces radicis]RKN03307.1 NAD-dependent epimerase/dehydratase family protein [Streptomyces radicis]RKN13188.1 NAD-dependent epimerase/dehydratase family protein [Streptomyces radicis]